MERELLLNFNVAHMSLVFFHTVPSVWSFTLNFNLYLFLSIVECQKTYFIVCTIYSFSNTCLLFLCIVATPGQRWSAHRVVRALTGLQEGHHSYWVWRCADHHIPHEEPHVQHPDYQETWGEKLLHTQLWIVTHVCKSIVSKMFLGWYWSSWIIK